MPLPAPSASNTAVVTGASQGIGRELAVELARRGWNVLLLARRADVLAELAAEIRGHFRVEATVRAADLSDPAVIAAVAAELRELEVGILCNNAGTATFGRFAELDPDHERAQVQLNAVAVHDLIAAVLPGMIERGAGGILNVGSAAGNMAIPGNATYAATKAFVNTFSESLRWELQDTGVHVTLLAPGPVRTEEPTPEEASIVDKMVPGFLWTSSTGAAVESLDALARNRRRLVPGALSKCMSVAGTYVPRAVTGPITGAFYGKLAE